jgi:hypothetical protein
MLTILLEVVQCVVPDLGSLVARIEFQSCFFSAGVFAYLLSQLWTNSRA